MKTMESTAAKMYLSDIELVLKNALSTSVWILPDQVVAICGVSTWRRRYDNRRRLA